MIKNRKTILILPLFILLILLTAFPVFASSVEVFNSWIASEQSIAVDNDDYTFHYTHLSDELIVTSDSGVLVINKGDCENHLSLQFCFDKTSSINTGNYSVLVNISRIEPEISITRDFSADKFYIGTKYTATITMTNEGDSDIENITMTESIPENLEVQSSKGCDIIKNEVIWKGDLNGGTDKECEYDFIPILEDSHNTKTKINYYDGYQLREVYSATKTIAPSSYMQLKLTTNSSNIELSEPVNLELNLTNLGEKRSEFNLLIQIPNTIEVIDYSSSLEKLSEDLYVWSKTNFDEAESAKINIEFRKIKSGLSTIYFLGNYTYDKKNYEFTVEKKELSFTLPTLIFTTTLSNSEELLPSEKVDFEVRIENPFEFENLTNLNCIVTSDLLNIPPGIVDVIIPNGRRTLVNYKFFPPQLNKSKSYVIEMNITAFTSHGEKFTERYTRKVTVSAFKPLGLSQSLSSSNVEEGDEVTVTVKVTNSNNKNFSDVKVYDKTPNSVTKKGQTSMVFSDLGKKSTETAYVYKLIAPKVSKQTNITVETILEYLDDEVSRTIKLNKTFLVKPRELHLLTTLSAEKSSPYLGERVPLTFKVTNNDEETAYNLKFNMPLSQEFMITEPLIVELAELDPGESVTKTVSTIIPSKMGKITVGNSNYSFEDSNGNVFTNTFVKSTVTSKTAIAPAALLWLQKNASVEGNDVHVTVTVTNNGTETAEVIVEGQSSFELEPGQEKLFSYDLTLFENTTLSAEHAYFTDIFGRVHAYSNEVFVEIETGMVNGVNNTETNTNNTITNQTGAGVNTTVENLTTKVNSSSEIDNLKVENTDEKQPSWLNRQVVAIKQFIKNLLFTTKVN